MEGANKFDPNEIPNMVGLLSQIFSEQRNPSGQELATINSFYMRYMGKAMDDCQKTSSTHWQVARPQTDVAFNQHVVTVEGKEEGLSTQFCVATTACMASDRKQYDQFVDLTQKKVLENFSEDDNYIVIFNRLVFNAPPELANGTRSLVRGLWIGCRLSKGHFTTEPVEAANEPSA